MTRELASRTTATGDRVTLYWYARSGRVAVEVATDDADGCEPVRAFVDPALALDAFRHPFVHLERAPALAAAAG